MKNKKRDLISTEELANAYCLAVGNGYRLIEDAERLYDRSRLLSVTALIAEAIRELAKAHLIAKAAAFSDNDNQAWEKFWEIFGDSTRLIDYLHKEVHPHVFKNREDTQRTEKILKNLKEDFFSVLYDDKEGIFSPPGQRAFAGWEEKVFAKEAYEYALALCKAMNIHGMPDPASQYKLFRFLKESGPVESQLKKP